MKCKNKLSLDGAEQAEDLEKEVKKAAKAL
jgi:hypothetical protein